MRTLPRESLACHACLIPVRRREVRFDSQERRNQDHPKDAAVLNSGGRPSGWETRLYLIEYSPGADGSGHHHPVVGLGYMLSGTILSAFAEDEAVATKEGQSFVDAAHQVHRVSRNASATEPLRFVIAYTVKEGEPVTVLPEASSQRE